MSGYSYYTEANFLDGIFGLAEFQIPSNIMVALSTADPLKDGTGIVEPVDNGYSRKSYGSWQRAVSEVSNLGDVVFSVATGAWGNITHFALYDDETTPNLLGSGTVTTPVNIIASDIPTFSSGQLKVNMG